MLSDDGAPYIYGAAERVSQIDGANTYYYLGDGLGSTMKTTDATGTVVNSYAYDVYGNVTSSSGPQADEFQFAGEQTDPTGLQYLRARYYDTASGTFISRDPLSSRQGWSGHPFGYTSGNPVNATDPSGLEPDPEKWLNPCNWFWSAGKACEDGEEVLDAVNGMPPSLIGEYVDKAAAFVKNWPACTGPIGAPCVDSETYAASTKVLGEWLEQMDNCAADVTCSGVVSIFLLESANAAPWWQPRRKVAAYGIWAA